VLSCVLIVGSQFTRSTSHSIAAHWRLLQLCTEHSSVLGHCAYLSTELRRRQLYQTYCSDHCVTHCAT